MMFDEAAIRRAVERWAIARDAGKWQELRDVWHPEGVMVATWFHGSAADFVTRSQQSFDRGVNVTHVLGGSMIDVRSDRALADTRMEIILRTKLHGELVDVSSRGRFYDFFSRHESNWRLSKRQCIYENSSIVTIAPGVSLTLDATLLSSYPEGYQYLAYAQRQAGLEVTNNLPGRSGPELAALYQQGCEWLGMSSTS